MANNRHKKDTCTFQELDYIGQARSINGQTSRLIKSINAHITRAIEEDRNADELRIKLMKQLLRAVNRIR